MRPIMLVVGTRPEGIKMMPLYYALKERSIPVFLCSTTQHDTLLSEVFELFDITPDKELQIMKQGQDLFHITEATLHGMKKILEKVDPQLVIVQGDTTTTMAAGLSAFYKHIPIGHIEAGLRTGDMCAPYPEEMNRKFLSLVARYHFAPTASSVGNLLAESKKRESVFLTGNTVVDSLRIIEEKIKNKELFIEDNVKKIIEDASQKKQKTFLFTMHRRESFGDIALSLLMVLKKFALENPTVLCVYPYHPNPHILEAIDRIGLQEVENIVLVPPLKYKDLVYLLLFVDFVVTDSGGIQEEAVSLGKNVIILREKSERMEGVWEGKAFLVGSDTHLFMDLLSKLSSNDVIEGKRKDLYGDGYAAEKIVRIIEKIFLKNNAIESPGI